MASLFAGIAIIVGVCLMYSLLNYSLLLLSLFVFVFSAAACRGYTIHTSLHRVHCPGYGGYGPPAGPYGYQAGYKKLIFTEGRSKKSQGVTR